MNTYLLIASILCFLLGLVHSILGEVLIFNDKRVNGSIVPVKGGADLKKRHLGILWATWHLTSIFGWCIGALLMKFSFQRSEISTELFDFVINSCFCAMLISAILVFVGTKGKHPGWIVLVLISGLLLLGNN